MTADELKKSYEYLKSRIPSGMVTDENNSTYLVDKYLNHSIPDMFEKLNDDNTTTPRDVLIATIHKQLVEAEEYLKKIKK